MKRILLYMLLFSLSVGYANAQGQKKIDVRAMQAALAEVIHRHSSVDGGDTIAAELAYKFRKYPEVLTGIAKAYVQNHATDKARKYLDQAIRIKPEGYSAAYVVKAGIFREENELDSASYYYEQAILADSTNVDGYMDYAMMWAKYQGGIDKSVAMLNKARGKVKNFNVDAAIADCYNESGDATNVVDAIGDMDWATLGENQMATYCANLYFANKYDKGVEAARYSSERWPKNMDFKKMLLWHSAQMKMYDDAISSGNAFLASDSESKKKFASVTYFSMAYAYLGKGQINDAISYFDKMDEISPDSDRLVYSMKSRRPSAIASVAASYKEDGNYQTALDMYDAIIKHYPESDIAYYLILKSQIYSQQLAKADDSEKQKYVKKILDTYSEIENKYPDNSNIGIVYFAHAEMLRSNSNDDEKVMLDAKWYYQKYYEYYTSHDVSSNTNACLACYWLAVIEWKINNDNSAARMWVDRGLDIDPMEQNLLKIDSYIPVAGAKVANKKGKK